MSTRESACRKFQANIFNKSKCQNCFKPREVHLLSDEDFNQAKPVYGGWLLLAPDGTNFDNPMHRSRKWQRRFFILYEHGLLRYALDEMPSTLAQGTINMNQCSDVIDGESRTGQKYSLCILTPDKESYIRAESKDIITGWQEALIVYPRTNKQNQKKKRKVEPATPQAPDLLNRRSTLGNMNGYPEPGPAKVAVTSSSSVGGIGSVPCLPSSIAQAERVPPSRASLWQEERWSRQTPPSIPTSRSASCLSEDAASLGSGGRKVRVESGYFSLEKPKAELSPEPATAPPLQSLPFSSRYHTSPDLHAATSPTSPPPLPSPSPFLSSSQSSLDSEPSWEEPSSGGSSSRAGRCGRNYVVLADVPRARRLNHREAFRSEKRQELRTRTRSPGREEVARLFGNDRRRSQVIERFEPQELQAVEHMETASSSSSDPIHPPAGPTPTSQRQGRSDRRHLTQKQDMSLDAGRERPMPDVSSSSIANLRRAKSLDRRVTESSMTPDLLNFKKGWMTKLYEDGLWKKHWFVLTDQNLRYYRDSIAEEAADLDGELDLSCCHDVTEYPVQRNYGFQIHSKEGVVTLSAMTSGIRRNWIQAIMKNVRPTVGPDVTRSSLPEERAKVRVAPDLTSQPTPTPAVSSQSPEVRGQPACDLTSGPAVPEQRRSRVRDRRRDGRSKTYDWSEFQQPQEREVTDRPSEGGEAEPAISSSSSTSSSTSSSSSSSSTPGSSPTSSPQTSSSLSAPPNSKSALEAQERVRQKEGRPRVPQTPAAAAPLRAQEAERESGQMEVDHARPQRDPPKTPTVQVEIEQRWHQVETTPLREEKQVPITSPSYQGTTPPSSGERLPPHERVTLLDKELGHTQKELARLQEQNSLLREQLQDARGREHSAREGYVLQNATPTQLTSSSPPSSGPHQMPWQRLHKANQDLHSELESQRRKQEMASQQAQCLRRSYSEAQDVLGHHEGEIEALQTKLSAAMAEIVASEQAVARMRSELKLEQTRCREREEECSHSETALRTQLGESEKQLREVEANLLERNQALRQLEQQQALQRDHQREVLRLQERLTEVTGRLIATEEEQSLREQREKKEKRSLEENQERERQALGRRLAESEERRSEAEERLQEAQQQVEALLRGGRGYGGGAVEEVQCLQEQLSVQTDVAESLRESVRMLEEERNRLTCRCQELLNQIAEADREVSKLQARLKGEETDYCTLESSYEKVSQEFQRISCVLREKEEEVRQTKEIYQRLVERKERELSEALIKMAALGSSLEETELRLQEKDEQLCQRGCGAGSEVEPCRAEKELQAKLVVAEDRIAELERHLDALRLGYADLRRERRRHSQEDILDMRDRGEQDESLSASSSSLTLTRCSSETDASLVKRQRIRFSSIQGQRYLPPDGGSEYALQANTSSDFTQSDTSDTVTQSEMDQSDLSFVSTDRTFQFCSDPEKFISIIQALEMKLLSTEEKLRELTQKLQDQHDHPERKEQPEGAMLNPWASPDDFQASLQHEEPDGKSTSSPDSDCRGASAATNRGYEGALVCVESCRERVRVILGHQQEQESVELQLRNLSEIEAELVKATTFMKTEAMAWEEPNPVLEVRSMHDLSDESLVRCFSQSLALEAVVLEKMAFSLQNINSDLLHSLNEISVELDKIKQSDQSFTMTTYAKMLTQKLTSELAFWAEVEKLESQTPGISQNPCLDIGSLESCYLKQSLINRACVKFELAYSLQSLRSSNQNRLKGPQELAAQASQELQQRAKAVRELVRSSGLQSAIQSQELGIDENSTLADNTPTELAPYMEQIEMEEAQEVAKEMLDRHLAVEMTLSDEDSVESHKDRERLAAELQKQAGIIRHLCQDVETLCGTEFGGRLHDLAETIRAYWGCGYSEASVGVVCMREALLQAQVAYTACKLRGEHQRELEFCRQAGLGMEALVREHTLTMATIHQQYHTSLQEERRTYAQTMVSLEEENQALRGEVCQRFQELQAQQEQIVQLQQEFHQETEALRRQQQEELLQEEQGRAQREMTLLERTEESQRRLECLLQEVEGLEERHEEQVRKLQDEFQGKIRQLEQHHEQEVRRLQARLRRGSQEEQTREAVSEEVCPMEEGEEPEERLGRDSMMLLRGRVHELESKMDSMRDELESKQLEGDVAGLKDKYQRDFDSLKATCERGFAAMEETHQKVVEDLQRQHQREICKLLEERERLLAEETAATIAAIEAMKNAHREEVEKTHRSQLSGVSADIDELRSQYEEELQSIHRELEVLSEQYSQKCLENAHLAQALQAERQALQQCQRENQELHTHNQELNNRLAEEITRMRSCFSGETATSPLTQGKDLYELEVLLRIKESEIQYLKQEISSLKDELQTALRDKKYASDKYKGIYTELSIVRAKADCDIGKLREKLLAATEALGERTADGSAVAPGYGVCVFDADIMKSKSNPDFLKNERARSRGLRSKSLKEGLTVQERMKLFEAKDSRKI
ncbi:protein outspread isoform X3 [Clupea harengus]|uniref:Protein outspread isoform X3 n=1 Tax=Clupea harengus TaxID=7950 RepID=A0A6P8F1U1_CLUHA|nr:protein outspread isoform X3 [Clupea harengus]